MVLTIRLGPATGLSGDYPDETHARWSGPAFRTHHRFRIGPAPGKTLTAATNRAPTSDAGFSERPGSLWQAPRSRQTGHSRSSRRGVHPRSRNGLWAKLPRSPPLQVHGRWACPSRRSCRRQSGRARKTGNGEEPRHVWRPWRTLGASPPSREGRGTARMTRARSSRRWCQLGSPHPRKADVT
jgi:hypothetical protein